MTSSLMQRQMGKFKLFLILIAIFIFSSSSVSASELLTAEDVIAMQSVSEIAVSPDGSLIAYTLYVPRNPFAEDNGRAYKELYLTDTDGNSKPFITGKVNIGSIRFTPDGQLISYLAKRNDDDTTTVLYGIPINGGESIRLVSFGSSISSYSWGPDSKTVAFLAKAPKQKEREKLKKKGFNAEIYEEDWRETKVWLYNTDDPEIEPIEFELEGSASKLCFSPDGTKLAMALQPTPSIDDNYVAKQVTIIDVSSGEVIVQFPNHGKLGQILFSPDSKNISIIAGHDIKDPAAGELYIASTETGSELNPIMTALDGHLSSVQWLDNKSLLYLMNTHVHAEFGRINADGSNREVLNEPSRPVLTTMVVSKNNKTVCFRADSPEHPSELYVTNSKHLKTRLTNSNPWLAERQFGVQEVIKYIARDGLELEGMLIHPVNETPGNRYPLVLLVHGGPESNRRDGWLSGTSSPAQVLAGQGYAVFVPNYRGSTGRGVAFSKMGQAGYAEAEFDDLVDAIDHLVKMGLVDRSKVGITGGSYGGYASAWAATALTEHFAASVMSVGVSDLISKFGTTDIPVEMYHAHAQSWPWERWEWYLKQSPIYYAQQSKTPTLILHGKNDTRVHPSQSMELYRYLKTFGQAPVRLVLYPGEGHGNGKAAAKYDFTLRLLRWMDHYLKGPGGPPPAYELDYSRLNFETPEEDNENKTD